VLTVTLIVVGTDFRTEFSSVGFSISVRRVVGLLKISFSFPLVHSRVPKNKILFLSEVVQEEDIFRFRII
jgi:hypothetical protein